MILFHGSTRIVDLPVYGEGRLDNDYGRGFYCTEDAELAREWAAAGVEGGFVNEYTLDTDKLRILNLCDGTYHILNWLALLMNNRIVRMTSPVEKRGSEYIISNYLPNISNSDIIIGYRADDSYFSFSRAFLSNTITIQQLAHAMKYGDLGLQFVLKSKKAFNAIEFMNASPIDGKIYYPKRMKRDMDARNSYKKLLEHEDREGFYLSDIMRKGVKNDDTGFFGTLSG